MNREWAGDGRGMHREWKGDGKGWEEKLREFEGGDGGVETGLLRCRGQKRSGD